MNIEEIKKKRNTGESIFTKYSVNKSEFKGKFNCFFEGKDSGYYGIRIKERIRNVNKKLKYIDIVNNIPCNGKKDVIYVYKKIKEKKDDNTNCFFIDRDYDDDNSNYSSIYITPSYSIENLYVTLDVFKEILVKFFYMNSANVNFKKCCCDYQERMKEFHEHMTILNAWIYCNIKNKNKAFHMSKINIKKIFDISIFRVNLRNYSSIVDFINSEFSDIKVDEIQLNEAINYFKQKDNCKFFRGKFELDFLIAILESIKIEFNTNQNNYFLNTPNFKITHDFNNNTLQCLSDCAETPECLEKFLDRKFGSYLIKKIL